jgi:hypothetical protein
MQLNNFLQRMYGQQHLVRWEMWQEGRAHQGQWVAVVYCRRVLLSVCMNSDHSTVIKNGLEYGRGTAHTLQAAKEEAACRALEALMEALGEQ